MTTKVTVDAHAGWPVKVTKTENDNAGNTTHVTEEVVPPNEVRDFYVHSHMKIAVEEVPKV